MNKLINSIGSDGWIKWLLNTANAKLDYRADNNLELAVIPCTKELKR